MDKTKNIIKLSDLLQLCMDFKKNPTAENEAKIQNVVRSFVVREYLPILDKQTRAAMIIGSMSEMVTDPCEAANQLMYNKLVWGLFSYVANVQIDIVPNTLSTVIIDLLYEMGIVSAILKTAEPDYRRLEKYIDDIINFDNIFKLLEAPYLFSSDKLEQFTTEVQSLKSSLTPESLADLKSLIAMTSPELIALKDTIVAQAVEAALGKELNTTNHDANKEVNAEDAEAEKDSANA